jgi:hypothetical protein
MSDYQSISVYEYPDIMEKCYKVAQVLEHNRDVEDVAMWSQKWPNICCGWHATGEDLHVPTWAPTVVVKFDKTTRYVFHNGKFAYLLKGNTTIKFYDAIRGKNLPGADDPERYYLVDGAQ